MTPRRFTATTTTPPPSGAPEQASTFTYNRSRMAADAKTDNTAKPSEQQVPNSGAEASGTSASESEQQAAERGYNPWEVLGLKPGASMHDVRQRYHDLLKECHPNLVEAGVEPNLPRVNAINKAYETITKAPTLDKRYRGLVTDTQFFYYKYLPEWMARNVDEMPRYYSWLRWRAGDFTFIYLVLASCFFVGRYYKDYPRQVTMIFFAFFADILFHTFLLPAAMMWLAFETIYSGPERTMAWLTSPRSFLQRELAY